MSTPRQHKKGTGKNLNSVGVQGALAEPTAHNRRIGLDLRRWPGAPKGG
jgi:hypothetical protein